MHSSYIGDETKTWDNYTVEANVRPDTGAQWVGIVFRAQQDLHEHYVYYLNVLNNTSEFWMHKKPNWNSRAAINNQKTGNSNNPAQGGIKVTVGKWHDMKVVCNGSKFSFYINGNLQIEHEEKTYKTGGVGVWAWKGKASFDNVKMTGGVVAAVDPEKKLAATWGSLKTIY